jgi:hypothetical protein
MEWVKGESISFLKKRNKKLLHIARRTRPKQGNSVPPEIDKSFLVLFSKKNIFLAVEHTRTAARRPFRMTIVICASG